MGRKMGLVVNGVAVVYILVTIVFFCFPVTLPVTVHNMNYSSVIAVGLVTLTALWWFVRGRRDYRGPQYSVEIAQSLPAVLETEKNGLS
jgi:ABC-type nickel/cobalt efflux system permease component RcnA